jgi:hypothetical protein
MQNVIINMYLQYIQTEEGKRAWLNAHLMMWMMNDTFTVVKDKCYHPAPPSVAEIWRR